MSTSSLRWPSSPRPLAAATALLLGACTSPERAPIPATTASISPAAPLPPPLATVTAAPSASAESEALDDVCDVHVFEKLEAIECYSKPRTLDYPDCREFTITRLPGDRSCHPEWFVLEITGYQAIFDDLRVRAVWEAGPPMHVRLVLEKVKAGLPAFTEKRGTEMATIVFDGRMPRELRLGPGMRSITRAKSAKITE
jgi:hypothetical protein